jgi:hypothetical protein
MKKTIYLPLFIFVCLFQFPELAYSQDTGSFFILWDKEGRGDITAPFGPPVSHADIFQYEGQVIQQSVYDELKLQVVDGQELFWRVDNPFIAQVDQEGNLRFSKLGNVAVQVENLENNTFDVITVCAVDPHAEWMINQEWSGYVNHVGESLELDLPFNLKQVGEFMYGYAIIYGGRSRAGEQRIDEPKVIINHLGEQIYPKTIDHFVELDFTIARDSHKFNPDGSMVFWTKSIGDWHSYGYLNPAGEITFPGVNKQITYVSRELLLIKRNNSYTVYNPEEGILSRKSYSYAVPYDTNHLLLGVVGSKDDTVNLGWKFVTMDTSGNTQPIGLPQGRRVGNGGNALFNFAGYGMHMENVAVALDDWSLKNTQGRIIRHEEEGEIAFPFENQYLSLGFTHPSRALFDRNLNVTDRFDSSYRLGSRFRSGFIEIYQPASGDAPSSRGLAYYTGEVLLPTEYSEIHGPGPMGHFVVTKDLEDQENEPLRTFTVLDHKLAPILNVRSKTVPEVLYGSYLKIFTGENKSNEPHQIISLVTGNLVTHSVRRQPRD